MSSLGRLARIWAWALIPAVALGLFVQARSEGFWESADTNFDRPISSQFRPGNLDPGAVRTLVTFSDFPVLWLGEEFYGYKLTSAQRDNYTLPGREGIGVDRLGMVYGTCEKTPGDWGCTPPLALIINAPGAIPCGGGANDHLLEGSVRGVLLLESADNTRFCIHEGISVEMQSNADIRRDEILQSLMLANATV